VRRRAIRRSFPADTTKPKALDLFKQLDYSNPTHAQWMDTAKSIKNSSWANFGQPLLAAVVVRTELVMGPLITIEMFRLAPTFWVRCSPNRREALELEIAVDYEDRCVNRGRAERTSGLLAGAPKPKH
jgi:hypothetical protein